MTKTRQQQIDAGKIAYLSWEHICAIIEAATNMRDKLLMWLLSRAGCRISEALAIFIDDINLVLGTITIVHLKRRLKLACPKCKARLSATHTFCPGCGGKVGRAIKEKLEQHRRRVIPIDQETLELLREYIKRGGPVNRNGRLLLFGINRHRAYQIISKCAEIAGIPKLINPETGKVHNVGPHSFRVAFTVRWIQSDDSPESLRALQEHLGHQSFATTMRYRKIGFEERRTYYDKIQWRKPDGS